MIQDFVGNAIPSFKATKSWTNNIIGSALACVLWGYLLYAGVTDPYGGIYTMWPLFGTVNQMLAAIALTFCTVVLFKMKRAQYAWVTLAPTLWLLACTVTAGLEKVFDPDPAVGFLSHAAKFSNAVASHTLLAPAKTLEQMNRVIFNDYLDAALAALAVGIVLVVVVSAIIDIRKAMAVPKVTAVEIGDVGAVLQGGTGD
jgi:carbon starvation protein